MNAKTAKSVSENYIGADKIAIIPPLLGFPGILPEIAHFGWGIWRQAERGGYPEQALDAYNITYTTAGCAEWQIEGTICETWPGAVSVIPPGIKSAGIGSAMHACELYWLILKIPDRPTLPGLSPQQSAELADIFAHMRHRLFEGNAEIAECFRRLIVEQRRPRACSVTIARAALHQLLVLIGRAHDETGGRQKEKSATSSLRIRTALALIEENMGEPLTIESVAKSLGVSKRYFHQEFMRQMKTTPADYLARRRMTVAKRLLGNARIPITQVAVQVGFVSSQHFSTAFKKMTGMTPSEFRRSNS